MLTLSEKLVMEFLFSKCQNNGNCLTSLQEIIISLSQKKKFTESKLKDILFSLQQEDYFDIIYSDRRGESVMVITLHAKGKGYPREKIQNNRQLKYKIIFAFLGAILSFIVGKILYLIFT